MPASKRMIASAAAALVLLSSSLVRAEDEQPDFPVDKTPDKWQLGQIGTNQCIKKWGASSPQSDCQTAYINSATDFCLYAPQEVGAIGDTERIEVSYCLRAGYGTRLIPDGTIVAAHFVKTPSYVAVLGAADLTKINVAPQDQGGELDPHGADGNGNPIGGLVYSNAFGSWKQSKEWSMFISADQFCFRACLGKDPDWNKKQCPHIYDVMGCNWNVPSHAYNNVGVFEDCQGEDGEPTGVDGTSTFYQDHGVTPLAHDPPASSMCSSVPTPMYNPNAPPINFHNYTHQNSITPYPPGTGSNGTSPGTNPGTSPGTSPGGMVPISRSNTTHPITNPTPESNGTTAPTSDAGPSAFGAAFSPATIISGAVATLALFTIAF